MLVHTQAFKNTIKEFGKEIDVKILHNSTILNVENINSVSMHYQGNILKSVMKELTIDSNTPIAIGDMVDYQFGVKVRNDNVYYRDNYDYVDCGIFYVNKCEKKEDSNSYEIKCYDKMIDAMVPYENLGITYPISIRDFISAICTHLGFTFYNRNDTFPNYDKMLTSEKFLTYNENDNRWESMGYTFRDVLDQLAEVTASTICIKGLKQLRLVYVNDAAITPFQVVGSTTQDGTPSPDNPVEIITKTGTITETINGREVTLDLGTLELCKIGDYQDYIYKDNGKWYKHSEIGKVVIDGSENWGSFQVESSGLGRAIEIGSNVFYQDNQATLLSNKLIGVKYSGSWNNTFECIATMNSNKFIAYLKDVSNLTEFTTKLASGYEVYYVLATPTNTEITDTDLIEQLENATYSDETINEEYLKDTNVTFKEQYGPVNTIVLSRSNDTDVIYYPAVLPENPVEIKISDNEIMNGNDRDEYLPAIYNQLNGLQFYLNDFSSTGICYLDLCDRYNVQIGENLYSCVMLNDEINVTQGVEEIIYTEPLEESVTDYTKADKTDRKINQTNLIVDKQQGQINALVESTKDLTDYINVVEGDSEITLTDSMQSNGAINYVEITNLTALNLYPDMAYPGNNVYPDEMTIYTIITQNDDNYNETYIDLGMQLGSSDKLIIMPTKIIAIKNGSRIEITDVANMFKTFDDTTRVSIKYMNNAHIKCEYLKKNDFTTQFATQAEVSSNLIITNNMISSKVSKAEVVSEINQSAEEVKIKANKISLEGLVTANNNFKILEDGSIETVNGKFSGIIDGGNIRVNGDNFTDENTPFIEIYTTLPDTWGNIGSAGTYMYTTGLAATNYDNNNYDTPKIGTYTSSGFAQFNGINVECSGSISCDGTVTSSRGVCQGSLYEIKKNFKKFNKGLEIIKNTDIYEFNYKNEEDKDKKHIGLVIGDNYNYSKEVTNKENDAVDLYSMVGVCFQAIKEQQEIIENLQNEIKKLKEVK